MICRINLRVTDSASRQAGLGAGFKTVGVQLCVQGRTADIPLNRSHLRTARRQMGSAALTSGMTVSEGSAYRCRSANEQSTCQQEVVKPRALLRSNGDRSGFASGSDADSYCNHFSAPCYRTPMSEKW